MSKSKGDVPRPPAQQLKGLHPYPVLLAKRLHRVALRAEKAEAMFDSDPRASSQWFILYRCMVDTASDLRHLIWTEGNDTKAERAVVDWINSIYPSDEVRSRWVREVISGLSPDHHVLYRAFEETLETRARFENSPRLASEAPGQRWEEGLAFLRKLHALAESVGLLQPKTPGDRQFQRLAIEYLHSGNYVFERRYRI